MRAGDQPGSIVRFLTRFVVTGSVVLVALLFWVAPSAAGAVFTLSDENRVRDPAIAVDEQGTSHIVWNVSIIGADDDLVYCRIPRGATGCDLVHRFNLPKDDFSGPKIVIASSGDIVLVTGRCCYPASPVLALISVDGGGSFGPPVAIASEFGPVGEVTVGPGDFSLALSGGNSGPDFSSIWRAAPLDGSSPDPKVLLSPFPKAYSVSTGFPDPTSPIVAYSDLQDVYFRSWDGTGDYNSIGNWLPEGPPVTSGAEPKLAGGVRGLYLIYLDSTPPYQYYVRSYDGSGFPASTKQVISDPKSGQSAIFRDFHEDGEGNLHAIFRQRTKAGEWLLSHRVSRDGNQTWQEPAVLARGGAADDLYHMRVGAAPDGGGGVVGDNNSGGRVWFAPFGPLGPPPGTCKPFVKLGTTKVRALKGCFEKAGKKNAWVAAGPVKVNGIDIDPKGGSGSDSAGAGASSGFKVTAIPGNRTLKTNGTARVHAGAVQLDVGTVNWKLPAKNGKVIKLAGNDGSVFKDLGKYTKELFDLPVVGDAELRIKGSGTEIPSHFRMPGILGSVTGNTTFETGQGGISFDGLEIEVPKAGIGLLHLAGIDIKYDGADRFTGTARVALPPQYSKSITEVTFGIEDGELSLLRVEPPPFTPALPIIGSPPSPMVGLDRIDFTYVRKPGSRLFTGGIYLIGGPKALGLSVDGAVSLEFPSKGPTILSAGGTLTVVKVPLGGGEATYTVGFPGSFKFNAGFSLFGFTGGLEGFLDLSSGKFSASGSAHSGPFGGEVVVSSKGIAACVSVPGPPPDLGFAWKWGGPPSFLCPDIGSFKISPPKSSSAPVAGTRAGAGTPAVIPADGVSLPSGLNEAAIAVLGSGGAPLIVVTGPDGEVVSSGPETIEQGRYRIVPVPGESRTIIQIGDPVGGNYSVEAQPGSVPISRILTARGLPQPKVTAKVRGKGRKRRLIYRVRQIDGQRVTFSEEGKGTGRQIGIAKRVKGRIRFSPAPGPRGRRRIVALVEQDGVPRAQIQVSRYRAPGIARPRRPKQTRALRRGRKLLVKWSRLRGVHGYEVRVNLPRDGRRLIFYPRSRQTRLMVGGIESTDRGRITVAGIGADAKPGRRAVAKLKSKRRRRRGSSAAAGNGR